MYSIGIDIGYSAVKVVLFNVNEGIVFNRYVRHRGMIKSELLKILAEVQRSFGFREIRYGAVTGSGSKFLSRLPYIKGINEVSAIINGCLKLHPQIRSIIEIGGESAKFITNFSDENQSGVRIAMNSNCSSGTGSFLEEQMSRLGLQLEDYSEYVSRAESIPRIAGRCSVFAKTDITHHQQEGVAVEDILLGLAYAVVRNYKAGVVKNSAISKPVIFVGGVSANDGIIRAVKDILGISATELVISEYSHTMAAVGSAVTAVKDMLNADLPKLVAVLENTEESYTQEDEVLVTLSNLSVLDSKGKHNCYNFSTSSLSYYLGIDIGSTSTNLVLMDQNEQIVAYKYLRTLGDPVKAVKEGLLELKKEAGDEVDIAGVATTGSGRYMIADIIGADIIKDEITSQARAAVAFDPDVDTIFEIGGQDSKFISIRNGKVSDFQMNKICAAGTGSFIEEQAKKFAIPIEEFGSIALQSSRPINLGERCTVFIEASIASCLAKGAELNDIAAGLCYSIVKNYLNRVVGQKKVGKKIFFQGGVAFNAGVVNAFRLMTGKEIVIPPFFSVTGAYGAAILAKEQIKEGTKFKGFYISEEQEDKGKERKVDRQLVETGFDSEVRGLIFENYTGEIDKTRKTIGIPRGLFTYGMFSMFYEVFKTLGFNVVMSEPTSEKTIGLGQQYSLDETCFPVKLITGHVAELVEKDVDYIFFPDLHSVEHPDSPSRKNYGCAYMQLAFKVMNQAVGLDKRGIELLSPTFAFSMGKEFMMQSFSQMGRQLKKSHEETMKAMQAGMKAFHGFEERIKEYSKKIIANIKPDEKVFVLISKIYGIADPVLNLGVPAKLADMGYKVLPFYALPEGDISAEYANMFWPFGQHILEPVQLIKAHPNLYAVYLSHHGCGPDSILSHYVKEIMADKPYLQIEVDEHASDVGVITRIEAFINSLGESVKTDKKMMDYFEKITHKNMNLSGKPDRDATLIFPDLYPYSAIISSLLQNRGYKAKVLPPTTRETVDRGRKFAITEEYFSLTAFLGDIFKEVENSPDSKISVFFPQNEGTETDGQYSRILQSKFAEAGLEDIKVISPFIEDLLHLKTETLNNIFLCIIAGDLILAAPQSLRKKYLIVLNRIIFEDKLDFAHLLVVSRQIYEDLKKINFKKSILAVGEIYVLYNDYLNNYMWKLLEERGYRVVYASLSEALWMFLQDYLDQNDFAGKAEAIDKVNTLKKQLEAISTSLREISPFENNLEELVSLADSCVGYYSGAFGRFRQAKMLKAQSGVDGIITASSMYENTGIVMNILSKGYNIKKPVLNMTFDGNRNESDELKIESFIYYL